MAETLAQFEADEQQKRAILESPAAVREREVSRTAFAGLSAAGAQQLLSTRFGSVLGDLNSEMARFLSDAELIQPLGSAGALVMSEGRKQLMEGTGPVQALDLGGTPEKIDLSLEETPDGYQPVNPLVELDIPSTASEPVEMGEEGLQIEQAGAEAASTARPFGDMNVFYPEVQTDTDLLVSPTSTGVEFFDQLRSEDSPEQLRFHVELPDGARIHLDDNTAEVIDEDGSKLAVIPPPTALDAQGAQISVHPQVDNESLVLEVEHRNADVAYPILVDPIIEEWYWQNWYEGKNLQALSSGAWNWWTSEGAGSSYVYGSTNCIYTCWGSGRGLYMDTPNGNLPANRWGQWLYHAPNSETYLANAWVSPFWRDNHVNCLQGQYGQPYDYVGMWNETSWNRVLYNQANDQGWSDIQSWGRKLVIGMGTSSGISIPCWRDVMAGGVRIWLEDWSRPDLTTSVKDQWMDISKVRMPVSAYDGGLGVKKFKATVKNIVGNTEEWWTNHSCTGLYEAQCPHTWNLGEGSQPELNFSPANMPEGIQKLSVTAYDAVEKPSFTTDEIDLKIDHAAPAISLSGTLTEQAKLGSELPSYTIRADASDGNPNSTDPADERAGVTKITFEVDGSLIHEPYAPGCPTQSCSWYQELEAPVAQMTPGSHMLKVRAWDKFGHIATKELAFSTGDKQAPSLSVQGGPTESSSPTYSLSFGSTGSGNGQFSHPADVAVDAKGNLWVADKFNNRIQKFNAKGEFLAKYGSPGSGNGQLNAPSSIAFDAKGNFWVAENGNNRIQQFNEKGEFIKTVGSAGPGSGQFAGPEGITIDAKGNIWVSDTYNYRIQEFNEKGEFIKVIKPAGLVEPTGIDVGPGGNVWITDWTGDKVVVLSEVGDLVRSFGSTGSGNGQFAHPDAIDVDNQGNVWVGDQSNGRIQLFNQAGEYVSQFGAQGSGEGQFSFSYPFGIATDNKGSVWIADANTNRLQKWQVRSPVPVYSYSFGSTGSGNGQFSHPADVAVDAKGNLWVADKFNNRIQKFNAKGEFLAKYGSPGSGNGQLNAPSSIAFDAKGNFLVADRGNNRIQKFNEKGEPILTVGSGGSGNSQFSGPEGIAVGANSHIWVADTYNYRIQEFKENGEFDKVVNPAGMGAIEPTGIDAGPGNTIWVTDWAHNRVVVLSESGNFIRAFGSVGSGDGQFNHPDTIDVDNQGNVWVGDQSNGRIQLFNQAGEYVSQFGAQGSGEGQFSFSYPFGIATDNKGSVWIADANNNRVQRWQTLGASTGRFVEPISAAASDSGFGVTSVAVKLTDELGQTDVIEEATQACAKGGCSLSVDFNELDLSERPAGQYTLAIVAADAAGNVSNSSRMIGVDPEPPTIALSGTLAERTGLPLNASSGELTVKASDHDLVSSGVKAIYVEREGQRVAAFPSGCANGCKEATASYRYSAVRDGAERSIEAAAKPAGSTSVSLSGISCISTSSCAAVGNYTNSSGTTVTLTERWNGATWQVQSSPNPAGALESRLESVSCTSMSDCTAVGYYKTSSEDFSTLVERWNGANWSIVSSPNPSGFTKAYLYGISCMAASNCWAVGKSAYSAVEEAGGKKPAALLERWNGSAWSIVAVAGAPEQLRRISCASASSCVAVSGQGLTVERWNGSSWSAQAVATPTGGTGGTLKGISCASESACTAVGAYLVQGHNAPLVERWNGSAWSVQTVINPVGIIEEVEGSTLEGVSCPTATACTATGTRSTTSDTLPMVEGWDGTEWSLQPAAIPSGTSTATPTAISCSASFDCVAVGSYGTTSPQALIEREASGKGRQTVTVEAVDKYGDAESKSIEVDVPEEQAETPTCNQKATPVAPEGVISAAEAVNAAQSSVPTAIAASQATIDPNNDEQVDPTYSAPKPNLESLGTPAEGETSVTSVGGFTLDGVACMTPVATTSAATEAKVVNSDAALFANTAPQTDTVIRPSAGGTTVVQLLRGSKAPTTISWNVHVSSEESLVKLPSGAIAITKPSEGESEGTAELPKPAGAETRQSLNDAEIQLATSEYRIADAQSETTKEVVAVIAQPWVLLKQGGIVPAKLELTVTQVPTEYNVTYTLPPFEPNFTPEAVVTEASASAIVNGRCLSGSPCGTFNVNRAVQYAEYWGDKDHPRNHYYYDYGDNNCTNFLSQILTRGEMSFMRAFDHGDGSWWYFNTGLPSPLPDHEDTESWRQADKLPRHLWQFGLAHIDPSNQPSGWTAGDLLAEDWYVTNGKGDFNHVQFVVGTRVLANGTREPLVANESSPGSNYSHLPWVFVKERIEKAHGSDWNRVALAVKHTVAALSEKKHDPDNLYGPNGVFGG